MSSYRECDSRSDCDEAREVRDQLLAALEALEKIVSAEIQSRDVPHTLRDKVNAAQVARTAISRATGQ